MLEIISFTLGPAQTNAYLVADSDTNEAVVIDPAWDGHVILAEAEKRGWRIGHLWYTHAHFDHIGNRNSFSNGYDDLNACIGRFHDGIGCKGRGNEYD